MNEDDSFEIKPIEPTPIDFLLTLDQEGRLNEQFKLPVELQRPLFEHGLDFLVKNNDGSYWGIQQGTIPSFITSPRGQGFVDGLYSSKIVRFDTKEALQTVDMSGFFPNEQLDRLRIIELYGDGNRIFVQVSNGQLLVLHAKNGSLIAQLPFSDYFRPMIVPMTDGRFGVYEKGTIKVYENADAAQSLKEAKQINLSDISPMLASPTNDSLRATSSGKYIYENYGMSYVLDDELSMVLSQTLLNKTPFSVECIGCSEDIHLVAQLHETMVLRLEANKIRVDRLQPIQIKLHDNLLPTDSPVYLDSNEGRVWVPLRAAAEAVGIHVDYENK